MGAIVCRNCREVLVEIEPRRNSNAKETQPPRKCRLEEEGNVTFYRCPCCNMKNVVAETRTQSGFPQLVIIACLRA